MRYSEFQLLGTTTVWKNRQTILTTVIAAAEWREANIGQRTACVFLLHCTCHFALPAAGEQTCECTGYLPTGESDSDLAETVETAH